MALATMYEGREGIPVDAVVAALEALHDCVAHCLACADACLGEDDVDHMRRCIRADLDCAAICRATADVIASVGSSGAPWRELLQVCITMCNSCAEECGSHDHDHCRACAEACRRCAEACQALLDAESADA